MPLNSFLIISRVSRKVSDFESLVDAQGWQVTAPSSAYVELLSRFDITARTLSFPAGQATLQTAVRELVLTYPFLLHAALAPTTAHAMSMDRAAHDFSKRSLYHAQLAIQQHSQKLQVPKDRAEADSILATCFMLNALFYLAQDECSLTSIWVLDGSEGHKSEWSTSLAGPRTLLQFPGFSADIRESMWWRACGFRSWPSHKRLSLESGTPRDLLLTPCRDCERFV